MAHHEERARRVPEVARRRTLSDGIVTEPTHREADGSTGQVASARQKFHCPACGAEANWNPAKQALICPFCGTESPATLTTVGADTVIVEHDLAAALRAIPDSSRGWQAPKTSVRCQSCQAISVFDAEMVGRRCDFCGSTALVPYEEVKDPFRPESLLPLKISETQARDLIRAVVRPPMARAEQPEREGAHRHREGDLSSVLDVRRERRRAMVGRRRQVLLRARRQPAGAEGQLDAGRRRDLACVRRRAGVRVGGCGRGQAAAHRAVSDRLARAVRPRVSRRLDGGAVSDRSGGGGRTSAGGR